MTRDPFNFYLFESSRKDTVYDRNEVNASGWADAINLIERLELFILKTRTRHDELYDEKLKISKQLLSKDIFTQGQLDKFCFNYACWYNNYFHY